MSLFFLNMKMACLIPIDSRSNHVCGVRGLPADPEDPAEDGLHRGSPEGGGPRAPRGAGGGKEARKWRALDSDFQCQVSLKRSEVISHSVGKETLHVNVSFRTKLFRRRKKSVLNMTYMRQIHNYQ